MLEKVAEAGATEIEFLASRSTSSPAGAVAGVWIVPVGSELVVFFPLLGIAQNFVGLIDLLELGFGCFFVLGGVGMVETSQFAEGLLDLVRAGIACDAKGGVVVFKFGGHDGIQLRRTATCRCESCCILCSQRQKARMAAPPATDISRPSKAGLM